LVAIGKHLLTKIGRPRGADLLDGAAGAAAAASFFRRLCDAEISIHTILKSVNKNLKKAASASPGRFLPLCGTEKQNLVGRGPLGLHILPGAAAKSGGKTVLIY
jgi:hypothetical protein